MSFEITESYFTPEQNIEVVFSDAESGDGGKILLEMDCREDGRYYADFLLEKPQYGEIGLVRDSRDDMIAMLSDIKQLKRLAALARRDSEIRM